MKKEYSSSKTQMFQFDAGENFAALQAVSDSADGDACVQEDYPWLDDEEGTMSGSWKKSW